MDTSQNVDVPDGTVDIDPTSSLLIQLYLHGTSAHRERFWKLPSDSKDATETTPPDASSPPTLSEDGIFHPHSHLTFDAVMKMPLDQVTRLQERVAQMEQSNYRLLAKIYGRFPPGHQPFPMTILTTSKSTPGFLATGARKHRELIWSQYQKMISIALGPAKCMGFLEPASLEGALILQQYEMQLHTLVKQRQRQRKGANEQQGKSTNSGPVRKSPRRYNAELAKYRHSFGCFPVSSADQRHTYRRFMEGVDTTRALADYQMQLMLLEEQNKKRLMAAQKIRESKHVNDERTLQAELGPPSHSFQQQITAESRGSQSDSAGQAVNTDETLMCLPIRERR